MKLDIRVPKITHSETAEARLEEVLERMSSEIEGLKALVVGDSSGLPVASLTRGPNTLATTAMATLALTSAMRVTSSLGLPEPDDILMEAGDWNVLVQALDGRFTISAVFPASANLGFVKLCMRNRRPEIQLLLEEIR